MMIERLQKHLKNYKKKQISIDELQQFSNEQQITYEQLAAITLQLEQQKILTMVKSHGRTIRQPSLANTYRIQQAALHVQHHQHLQQLRLSLHKSIHLDRYFRLDQKVLMRDLPCLLQINEFLIMNGLPSYAVPAPERSFELVGNEKWIEEGGGMGCLKRIGLWDAMKIMPVADPLMFAVNGRRISEQHDQYEHLHLIVENKTTYKALLPALKDNRFTTLIYGRGWQIDKVDKNMAFFHEQLIVDGTHKFYYFGDLDRAGLSIWYKLHTKIDALPATPFYNQCLKHPPSFGKETQTILENALPAFLSFFKRHDQSVILEIMETNDYLPQEVLKTRQLQQIWREWSDRLS